MAENKMTRAQALEFAIEVVRDHEGDCEAIGVLEKMHAQVTKPRKKSGAPSKARILNESLATKCVEAMRTHGEAVTSAWLMEHVNGLMTPQKVTAVMAIAIERGEATKAKEGKAVTYSIA